MIKKLIPAIIPGVVLALAACSKAPSLELNMSDKYNGQKIEIINYLDSTVMAESMLEEGYMTLVPNSDTPTFTAVVMDGKTKAFYITDPGNAVLNDSAKVASGTPLNDKFAVLINQLDSVEQLDDMAVYVDFVEKQYNENKNNPIGQYFGVELLRFADPQKIDSIIAEAPEVLKNSPKAAKYVNFARLRAKTSPGQPYVDFEGENAQGEPLALSSFVNGKNYVLVDFWASWCPYCIKELPEIAALNSQWEGKGLTVVGVAVRDLPEDTKAAVEKHKINWDVIYNTQKKAYDLYGIVGIPEHLLIDPEGKIVLRGESIEAIGQWLEQNIGNKKEGDK